MYEENNNVTGMPDNGMPADAPMETATVAKVCSQCGTPLTAEQVFCPNCGNRADVQQVAGEVNEAIAQFNQGVVEQAAKKKKSAKVWIIVLSIVGVLVAAVIGMYMFFNSRAEGIIEELNSDYPSADVIETDYNALTPVGQLLFRDQIVDTFVENVIIDSYTNPYDGLVNETALERYQTYYSIGLTLEITEDDGTNVMAHISKVLELEDYVKYNGIEECMGASISKYTDCLKYINNAADSSSYYVTKLYVGYAHTYAKSALSNAKSNNAGDSYCTQYISSLSTIETELSDLYYGNGYFSSSSVTTAMNTINNMVSELADAEGDVKDIVNAIPEITY